jgi:HNH/ENDO VII superfamily nuclease with conserved GHE residues
VCGPGCDRSVVGVIAHNETAGPAGSSGDSASSCGPNGSGCSAPAPATPAAPGSGAPAGPSTAGAGGAGGPGHAGGSGTARLAGAGGTDPKTAQLFTGGPRQSVLDPNQSPNTARGPPSSDPTASPNSLTHLFTPGAHAGVATGVDQAPLTRLFNPTTTPATATSGVGTPTSATDPSSGQQPPFATLLRPVPGAHTGEGASAAPANDDPVSGAYHRLTAPGNTPGTQPAGPLSPPVVGRPQPQQMSPWAAAGAMAIGGLKVADGGLAELEGTAADDTGYGLPAGLAWGAAYSGLIAEGSHQFGAGFNSISDLFNGPPAPAPAAPAAPAPATPVPAHAARPGEALPSASPAALPGEAVPHPAGEAVVGSGLANRAAPVPPGMTVDQSKNDKDPYTRPKLRKSARDSIYENGWGSDGKVRKHGTDEEVERNGEWDAGHKPGYEFRKHQGSARERGIPRSQYRDEHNNPDHYRVEDRNRNRSHVDEDKTNNYKGS